MLNNLEREERARIPEASDKLVEPFRKVVSIAMQRVREGTIENFNRQTVTLSDDVNSMEYKITDRSVGRLRDVVISTGLLDVGLFILGSQLIKADNVISRFGLFSIQLPRDPNQVNKETLYWQRGSEPKKVKMLADALSSARKL